MGESIITRAQDLSGILRSCSSYQFFTATANSPSEFGQNPTAVSSKANLTTTPDFIIVDISIYNNAANNTYITGTLERDIFIPNKNFDFCIYIGPSYYGAVKLNGTTVTLTASGTKCGLTGVAITL